MNPHDDHAVAFLRRSVIGGVHLRHTDAIETLACLLKAGEMLFARFAVTTCNIWMRESGHDPAQIVGKRDSGEPPNILENETARLDLAYGPNGLGPHVSAIFMATMSAANRKRLTRRPPRYQIDSRVLRPVNAADVFLMDRPIGDML